MKCTWSYIENQNHPEKVDECLEDNCIIKECPTLVLIKKIAELERKQKTDSPRIHNLLDKTFCSLKVIGRGEPMTTKNGHAMWRCKCVCGTIKDIKGQRLETGRIKSCGCKQSVKNRKRIMK
jgi:hypothetical protein